MDNKLKIGLLIQDYDIPYWALSTVEKIVNSTHNEIALLITDNSKYRDRKRQTSIWSKLNSIVFRSYMQLESLICKLNQNALQKKNIKTVLPNCDQISTKSHSIDQLIDTISKYDLDVIVDLNHGQAPIGLSNTTNFGIWHYNFDDLLISDERAIGATAMLSKAIYTRIKIEIEQNGRKISAYNTTISKDKRFITRHTNQVLWKVSSIVPRLLQDLNEKRDSFFNSHNASGVKNDISELNVPGNIKTIVGVFKLFVKGLKEVWSRKFYFDQWILLVQHHKTKVLPKSFEDYQRLLPPKDRFWADPFVIQEMGKTYIFIEELLYKEGIGKIAVIELNDDGTYKQPYSIIEKDYHLSYPYLFRDDNTLYLLPESMENGTIELYRCVEFPKVWKLEKILMKDIKALDTSILKHNNKYWMFTNIEHLNGHDMLNELHIFYADDLISDNWVAHPKNPITINQNYARPAGQFIHDEGRIFRPSQNCSKHYGYAITFMEILKLTEDDYQEVEVSQIFPDWNKDVFSTHTFNSAIGINIADAKIKRRR